ncbi:MAG: BON domain-containing protein [Acidobacteriota bacterium]|nr:BON domain-containing protein [Acidobacteriota bacterium]
MKYARYLLVSIATLALSLPLAAQSAPAPQSAGPSAVSQDSYIPVMTAIKIKTPPANEDERIAHEVRHELLLEPYYGMWDWLAFRVKDGTVELTGWTFALDLHSSAVKRTRQIKGVKAVVDHITDLPPSSMDERLRHQVAHAIFSWGGLARYSWPAELDIHIIVNNGRVTLEGLVDNQADKDAAFMRASGVPGIFQVTNNLRVAGR